MIVVFFCISVRDCSDICVFSYTHVELYVIHFEDLVLSIMDTDNTLGNFGKKLRG